MQPNINNNVMFIMPLGSNHAVQSVAVHAPKFWLWFCAVS